MLSRSRVAFLGFSLAKESSCSVIEMLYLSKGLAGAEGDQSLFVSFRFGV